MSLSTWVPFEAENARVLLLDSSVPFTEFDDEQCAQLIQMPLGGGLRFDTLIGNIIVLNLNRAHPCAAVSTRSARLAHLKA